MTQLYLCGAGNSEGVRLALRINREHARWDRIILLDDDAAKQGRSILGVEVAGPLAMLEDPLLASAEVANLVARTTAKRWAARSKIESYGLPFAALIGPNVDIAGVEFGKDVIIYQNATVGPEVSLGEGTVVFMGGIVGHESRLGRCCVVAPNAVINARVQLEDGVYVGTNATILPEVKVGSWATIGAGSVVIDDVQTGATVMGVPAEIFIAPKRKPDREALCSGGNASREFPEEYVAPTNPVEEVIAGIWSSVLGVEKVGISDNFFNLGGNSLSAVELALRLNNIFKITLPQLCIFRAPTVAKLSQVVIANEKQPGQSEKIARIVKRIEDMPVEKVRRMIEERRQ